MVKLVVMNYLIVEKERTSLGNFELGKQEEVARTNNRCHDVSVQQNKAREKYVGIDPNEPPHRRT
jgi:hypothetical protein